MDLSLFFAKLFAVYFIAAGVSLLAKRDAAKKMIHELTSHPFLMYFAGFFVIILGMVMVLLHNVWDGSWRVLITVIAWLTFLKGLAYLWLPPKTMASWAGMFTKGSWYTVWSWVVILLGLYLAWVGFLA